MGLFLLDKIYAIDSFETMASVNFHSKHTNANFSYLLKSNTNLRLQRLFGAFILWARKRLDVSVLYLRLKVAFHAFLAENMPAFIEPHAHQAQHFVKTHVALKVSVLKL